MRHFFSGGGGVGFFGSVCLTQTVDLNQGRLYNNSTFKFGCQQSPSGLHIVPTFEFPTLKLSATPPSPLSARG